MGSIVPTPFRGADLAPKIELIAYSFLRQTRRPLIQKSDDVVAALWMAPCAVIAQDAGPQASCFFANRCALEVLESDHDSLTDAQGEAARQATFDLNGLFANADAAGKVRNYSGNLTSSRGNRYRVQQALTWPIIDDAGTTHGRAAMFDLWIALD